MIHKAFKNLRDWFEFDVPYDNTNEMIITLLLLCAGAGILLGVYMP